MLWDRSQSIVLRYCFNVVNFILGADSRKRAGKTVRHKSCADRGTERPDIDLSVMLSGVARLWSQCGTAVWGAGSRGGAPVGAWGRSHIISSYHNYHNVHFWGASSKTPAPRPLNKQVSFQQCCECSRGQCRITNAGWQAVPDAWAGDSKWSGT